MIKNRHLNLLPTLIIAAAALFVAGCQTMGVNLDETGKVMTFRDEIDEYSFSQFQEKFTDNITTFRIDSPGGTVNYTKAIYLTLAEKGVVVITGKYCQSACTHIAIAAPLLVAPKHAQFLIHSCHDGHGAVTKGAKQCNQYQHLIYKDIGGAPEWLLARINKMTGIHEEYKMSCDAFKANFKKVNVICDDALVNMDADQIKIALKDRPEFINPIDRKWRAATKAKIEKLYHQLDSLAQDNQPIDLNAKVKQAGFKDYKQFADAYLRLMLTPADFDIVNQLIQPVTLSAPIQMSQNKADKIYSLIYYSPQIFEWQRDSYEQMPNNKAMAACVNLPKLYQMVTANPTIDKYALNLPSVYYFQHGEKSRQQANNKAVINCQEMKAIYALPNCSCTVVDKNGRNALQPDQLQTQLEDWLLKIGKGG